MPFTGSSEKVQDGGAESVPDHSRVQQYIGALPLSGLFASFTLVELRIGAYD